MPSSPYPRLLAILAFACLFLGTMGSGALSAFSPKSDTASAASLSHPTTNARATVLSAEVRELGGLPSEPVPVPEDTKGEDEKELDDEREKDLALLTPSRTEPLASLDSRLTPALLFRPGSSLPRALEKPPRA